MTTEKFKKSKKGSYFHSFYVRAISGILVEIHDVKEEDLEKAKEKAIKALEFSIQEIKTSLSEGREAV